MKKILFITYNNPEKASRGDDLYSWNIINSIKHDKNIYLHVVAYYEDAKDKKQKYSKLENVADKLTYVPFIYKNILAIGFSRYPAMISNRKTPQMIKKVIDILNKEKFDAIFVNMFRLGYLINYIKPFPGVKVFISHNVETQLSYSTYIYQKNPIKKLAYYLDYIKTKYYEKKFISQFDCITTICDVDKETFSTMFHKQIEVLPPVINIDNCKIDTSHIEDKFIICGAFHWGPKYVNLKLLLASKNIGKYKESGHELMIVGRANKKDVDYVNKNYPGIHMTGPVETVIPYYEKARIAIVPELVGGGFKLKIAEAVQYSKPIVAIKGSVTDKSMIPGKHYIEADNFDDLIIKSLELMNNPKLQSDLVYNARQLFKNRYTKDYAVQVINRLLKQN
mgnify:CR=1 FL=1